MNGVLHSEHVISRSGIAVSPPKVIEDPHSLALRSAGVAFLSTTGRGAKALFLQTHAEKPWRPDGFLVLSVLQQLGLFKFLNEPGTGNCGRTSSQVFLLWLACHT